MDDLDRAVEAIIAEAEEGLLCEAWSAAARAASLAARRRKKGMHSALGLSAGVKGAVKRSELARFTVDERLQKRIAPKSALAATTGQAGAASIRQAWQKYRGWNAIRQDRQGIGVTRDDRAMVSKRTGPSSYKVDTSTGWNSPFDPRILPTVRGTRGGQWRNIRPMGPKEIEWATARNTAATKAYARGEISRSRILAKRRLPKWLQGK